MAIDISSPGAEQTSLRRALWTQVNKVALSRVTTPPGSPSDGDVYIVPDDDLGNPNEIAIYEDADWTFITPEESYLVFVLDEDVHVRWSGTAWIVFAGDLDIDGTLAANADDLVPSQKAVKTYVDKGIRRTVFFVIDGGGSPITTGIKGDAPPLPFAGVIEEVTLLADQAGSIVIDIWKDTYANFPPDVADTIVAAAKPTLSAAVKAQDSTLTGWTTAVAVGDILRFNVDSAATVQRVTIGLKVRI